MAALTCGQVKESAALTWSTAASDATACLAQDLSADLD